MDLDLGAIGEDERVWGRNKVSDCERGEEMRDWQKDFVERKRKFKSWKGSDEMKKVKRNKIKVECFCRRKMDVGDLERI